ncbi:hypothetical protein LCY76_20560 [Fictibacillus sp. KIGAM418]|uniref:Uncharacterized protein n=1 Tax=Fictibacillus marinisediminis TaxID=2878389 RepID=A0A9X1XDQ0_9BACL|nr:hypothetical protein [Fictibacillus marinisediminis]MCK6258967.1 hypothetical protein [Fictibacillus marinisediminis]
MKKLTAFFALVCGLVFSASPANAAANGLANAPLLSGSGSWDYIGWDTFTKESEIFRSGGGDFKYCRDKYDSGTDVIELWEYDPESYNDYVGSRSVAPGDCEVFNSIGGFTDGTDGQAEFFLKKSSTRYANVYFYD